MFQAILYFDVYHLNGKNNEMTLDSGYNETLDEEYKK